METENDSTLKIHFYTHGLKNEVIGYYQSLWNNIVIQQEVFNRLKISYYIASSMNNSKIHEVSNFSSSQFLQKMQKHFCKLPKHFTNCKLWRVNLNPGTGTQYIWPPILNSYFEPWISVKCFGLNSKMYTSNKGLH